MLGDFALKTQNWEGKFELNKHWFGRNKIRCAENNHKYIIICVKRNSQIRTFIKQLLAKYPFFKNPNFLHILTNCFCPVTSWQ